MTQLLVNFETHRETGSLPRRAPETVLGAAGPCRWYLRGLGALAAVISGLTGPGARVMVPAFICHDVIKLVEGMGRQAALYAVAPNLEVDLEDLQRHLRPGDIFLYVRYFGLGDAPAAVALAREAGAVVLEDSSQAPFAYHVDPDLRPDLAFTSLRKYLPVLDGSALDTLQPELAERIAGPLGRPAGRLLLARAAALRFHRVAARSPRRSLAALAEEMFAQVQRELRRAPAGAPMSRWSARMLAETDLASVAARRRANYATAVAGLAGLRAVRALWPRTHDSGCPYGCPVVVPNNRLWRDALQQRGIQAAILWDREDHWAGYPASQWLAEHLLVLPVTQTHTEQDMARVVAVLREYDGDQ